MPEQQTPDMKPENCELESLPRTLLAQDEDRKSWKKLAGKRVGMVVLSSYPADARPRRAIDAMLQQGMEIDLLCEADEGLASKEQKQGLTVTRLPIRHQRGGALGYAIEYTSFILLATLTFAWRALRRRYDLVYVHNMPDVLVISALIPKLLGAKVILDQHDPMPELMTTIFKVKPESLPVKLIRSLERWSIGRSHRVITVNEACRQIFSARSCSVDKIAVVMNTPDEKLFPFRSATSYPEAAGTRPLIVMYHGSLVERNGLGLAVDAAALLRQSGLAIELRAYGRSTPYLEEVMDRVQALDLQHVVKHLGARRLEQLAHEIEQCDIGVVPNQQNTFTEINTPTRIFEYLALGKPVIAPSTRGILDYFGENSLLYFRPGDAEDLAKQIRLAALRRGDLAILAQKGQEIYAQHTWREEKKALLDAVGSVL
jgi:glycosyltransferase involved in cell wall biosynthesis